MKKKIKQVANHPLITGSTIIFSGTLIANILNFIFNWYMRRNLTNADYGVLASLIALFTLPIMAVNAFSPGIIQFASNYIAEKKFHLIKVLFIKTTKLFLLISIILFFLILIFIKPIGVFFRIDDIQLLIITDFIIVVSILMVLNTTFLQAKLEFNYLSFTTLLNSILKMILGILFVYIGWRVAGGVLAIFITFIISYIITFFPLKKIFKYDSKNVNIPEKQILLYSIPSAITIIGITLLMSNDLFLVKHFFIPDDAGIYAGISLAGKVIYFFSAPIATVMFPLIVQKNNRKESYHNTFLLSLLLVSLSAIGIASFYFIYPNFILTIFGIKSLKINLVTLLYQHVVFSSLFGLLSLIVNFYLSIKITKIFIPVILAAIFQAIIIWFFHNSLYQILSISIIIIFLLLLLLLLYYPYVVRKETERFKTLPLSNNPSI